tara:strand:- start:69 stop:263 length:195 start_codon:yes stop_codon:yes gene_type:complete
MVARLKLGEIDAHANTGVSLVECLWEMDNRLRKVISHPILIDSSSGLPEKLKISEKVANSHFFS